MQKYRVSKKRGDLGLRLVLRLSSEYRVQVQNISEYFVEFNLVLNSPHLMEILCNICYMLKVDGRQGG